MPNSADTVKQFFANIDKAQAEIWHTLFPYLPATPENLAQIQPRIRTKSFLPNEEIPPILEFDITPNHPLVLNTLRLWRLAQYHLHFTNIPNITINQMYLDIGNDIQDNRYERKTLGKFTFRGCAFTEITMGLCDFEELHFYNCIFKGKVDFADCHFQKLEFQNCVSESSITFDRAIFENKAFFIHSTFKDSASFRHSQYMQGANFSQSIFMQKIDCTEVRFQDFANFTHTTFKDYADFSQCEFEKTANFYGAKFEKAPNFSQVQFKGSLNAVNMDLDFGFTNLKEIISGEFKTHNNIAPQKQGCFQKIKQRISAKLKKEQANDKKPTITKPLTHFANDFRDSFRIFKNALIKARSCYQAVGIPTMATDDTLFLEGVPTDKQPGVYVRRINGKRLSDEEAIEYYSNLVRQYGKEGKLIAKYVYGLALVTKDKEQTYTWNSKDFYIIDKPSEKLQTGYPLNSISVDIKSGKYFTDITSEEKDSSHDNSGAIDFIVKNSEEVIGN